MVFFVVDGQWLASEKLVAMRSSLLVEVEESLDAALVRLGCVRIAPHVWRHEPSDTIVCLSCVPRTHG